MKHLPLLFRSLAPLLVAATLAGCSDQAPKSTPSSDAGAVRGDLIAPAAPAESKPEAKPETVASVPPPLPVPAETPATPAPAAMASKATERADGEYASVGFDQLAGFEYEMPDESNVSTNAAPGEPTREKIPADIKALNTKKVALKGFMLPLKVEGGLITELLVMRDQSMCCFGTVPKINEWVSVKMIGKGVKPIMDQAVTIYGSLKVGEMYESGYLVGIYALDGDHMAGPLDL